MKAGPRSTCPIRQNFVPGYFAWRKPEFKDYFNKNYIQLPLAKGDAVFLSPALFHAAGHNRTKDIKRMANLLQVSSAYGRAMESHGPRRHVGHSLSHAAQDEIECR